MSSRSTAPAQGARCKSPEQSDDSNKRGKRGGDGSEQRDGARLGTNIVEFFEKKRQNPHLPWPPELRDDKANFKKLEDTFNEIADIKEKLKWVEAEGVRLREEQAMQIKWWKSLSEGKLAQIVDNGDDGDDGEQPSAPALQRDVYR